MNEPSNCHSVPREGDRSSSRLSLSLPQPYRKVGYNFCHPPFVRPKVPQKPNYLNEFVCQGRLLSLGNCSLTLKRNSSHCFQLLLSSPKLHCCRLSVSVIYLSSRLEDGGCPGISIGPRSRPETWGYLSVASFRVVRTSTMIAPAFPLHSWVSFPPPLKMGCGVACFDLVGAS